MLLRKNIYCNYMIKGLLITKTYITITSGQSIAIGYMTEAQM